jgi:hypothetical protein
MSVNLTSEGSIDWRVFNYIPSARGTIAGDLAVDAGERMAGGSAISFYTPSFATSDLQGLSNYNTIATMSWTNGATATTEVGVNPAVYNWPTAVGDNFQFTVAAGSTPQRLSVYAGCWNSTVELRAWFGTDTPTVIGSQTTGGGGGALRKFTFDFSHGVGQSGPLNVQWITTSGGGGNAPISAVTLAPVPEPASMMLVALGSGLALLRRRRH